MVKRRLATQSPLSIYKDKKVNTKPHEKPPLAAEALAQLESAMSLTPTAGRRLISMREEMKEIVEATTDPKVREQAKAVIVNIDRLRGRVLESF